MAKEKTDQRRVRCSTIGNEGIASNFWNRLAISFRSPAGSYQPIQPITKSSGSR